MWIASGLKLIDGYCGHLSSETGWETDPVIEIETECHLYSDALSVLTIPEHIQILREITAPVET